MESGNIHGRFPAIDWTIATKLNTWQDVRKKWENDFNANYKRVAEKISEFLTQEIFTKIAYTLSNPYRALPSYSNRLRFAFSLEIERSKQAATIKEWAQDSAKLPPFREWFERFEEKKQEYVESKSSLSFASSSHPKLDLVSRQDIEVSYFQNQMSKIGHEVTNIVRANLSIFAKVKENAAFRFKVEWYQKSEKYLSSYKDDSLCVEIWLEPVIERNKVVQNGEMEYPEETESLAKNYSTCLIS